MFTPNYPTIRVLPPPASSKIVSDVFLLSFRCLLIIGLFAFGHSAQAQVGNCGIIVELSAKKVSDNTPVVITPDGKVCIPQCKRQPPSNGQQGVETGAILPCDEENELYITAVVTTSNPTLDLSTVSFNWDVNGGSSSTGFGGIVSSGATELSSPTGSRTFRITIKSNAAHWEWTPGTLVLKYALPPRKLVCEVPKDSLECGTCSGSSTLLKVYKAGQYPENEVIVGPQCLKPGMRVTYTIVPRFTAAPVGIIPDDYHWNLEPNGLYPSPIQGLKVVYFSGDRSSVTVDVLNNYKGDILKVLPGTRNNCNSVPMELDLGLIPKPFSIRRTDDTTKTSICLPADGTPGAPFELEIPSSQLTYDATYIWEASPGFTIQLLSDFPKNTRVRVIPEIDDEENCPRGRTGWVQAKLFNKCAKGDPPQYDPEPFITSNRFIINRSLVPGVHTIQSEIGSNVCVNDLGVGIRFWVDGLACGMAGSLTWELPEGWYHSRGYPRPFGPKDTGFETVIHAVVCNGKNTL